MKAIVRTAAAGRSRLGEGTSEQRARGRQVRTRAFWESRRPVSTPDRNSGCRLAVKRFALGFAGRPVGDGSVGHPLGGGEVGPGARRGWNDHGDVLL